MPDETSKEISPKLSVSESCVCNGASGDTFLVVSVPENASVPAAASEAYARIGESLRSRRMEIVQERVFGSLSVEAAVKTARREALHSQGVGADGPLNYIEGHPTWGPGFAGVIIHAVAADQVKTILDEGVPRGRTWWTDRATFIILQNLQGLPEDAGIDGVPSSQAGRMIERAEHILRQHGADYHRVVRTWIYLSNILDWYGEFNRARSAKYGEFGLMPGPNAPEALLPASTGIRADLPGGAACAMDLLAIVPKKVGTPIVQYLRNPGQLEAYRYGSAFARGAVIDESRHQLIEISGTAAIDENGQSLYPGDIHAQVRSTLDKVASLLGPVHASLRDICAATVFVKNGADADATQEVLTDMGLEQLPAVWVEADVCRDELLFEIDAEAIIPR